MGIIRGDFNMFIGKFGTQHNHSISLLVQSVNRSYSKQTENNMQKNAPIQKNVDTVEISASKNNSEKDIGIYRPNRLKVLFVDETAVTQIEKDDRLQAEILPPSEKSYTEQDAVMNQYMKQFRIEGHIEDGNFVVDGDVHLILSSEVSEEELEAFRQKLVQNGLGDEIDWKGVSGDFVQIGVGFGNIEKLESKADYLASRYAVLKDRIEKQYTGDKKEEQMSMLNDIYNRTKNELAGAYANSIGGFYEELGQEGIAEDMKNSLLTAIDEKASEYEAYLANAGEYAHIEKEENQWLLQDDGFMAAQLRESMSSAKQNAEQTSGTGIYSLDDLKSAGIYAKELNKQLDTVTNRSYNSQDDSELGKHLAAQYKEIKNAFAASESSNKLNKLIEDTFEPFIDKLIDKINQRIDKQKETVTKDHWMIGFVRTEYIDKNAVYKAFHTAIGK